MVHTSQFRLPHPRKATGFPISWFTNVKRSLPSLLALALLLGACQGIANDQRTEATPSPRVTAASTPSPIDLAQAQCASATGGEEGVLVHVVDVRVGAHPGFDRVTFEFAESEDGDEGIPLYQIQAAEEPFTYDPSGEPMDVEGSSFASVNFQGATGVRLGADEVEQTYTGPEEFTPDFEVLGEAELQGDFEATLSWILGLKQNRCWSVFELTDPLRVVIDLPHQPVE
jgi:hypothetical protein